VWCISTCLFGVEFDASKNENKNVNEII